MKLTITLTVLFYLIVDPIQIRAGNQGIQFANDSPSELFVSGNPQKHGAAMVVMLQQEDLREIYCKDKVLRASPN